MKNPKHAGIWIRVSTDKQAEGDSPEHHEIRAREHAKRLGWEVLTVYALEGISGKSVIGHPEAKRMMADVERGRIQALIFSDVSRLARNSRELIFLNDFFNQHGAKLIALSESIDTSTPDGEYFFTLRAGGAQYERRIIAKRIKDSVPVRAQLGKRIGAQAPLGYTWHNNQMVQDPAEVPLRRLIYELFAEHKRVKTVVRLLNEAGHRTRRGALFTHSTVERLIRDSTAKGVRVANYTQRSRDGSRVELKPESEWITVPVEPIISEELWQECQALLAPRKHLGRRLAKKPAHLFSGVVICGNCDKPMYPLSNSVKYTCQTCRRRIHPNDLEGIFLSQLRGIVLSPERLAEHIQQADAEVGEKAALLETLQTERAKLQRAMDRTYELYVGDHISPQQFELRHRPLEERASQLDAEIPELAAEVDARRLHLLGRDGAMAHSRSLVDHWPNLSLDDRRQVVETIVDTIIIGEDEVIVSLHPPPIPKEGVNWSRRYEGTKVRKYESTKVRRYESTKVRRYEGTKVRRYEGYGGEVPSLRDGRPSPPPAFSLVPRDGRRPLPQLRGRGGADPICHGSPRCAMRFSPLPRSLRGRG
jgi:site-specific DNA recombinase